MTLENPTNKEKDEFKKLQDKGTLPSVALQRLETERKLNISVDNTDSTLSKLNVKENWWFYLALGGIGFTMLYIYLKPPPPLTQIVP